MPDRISIWLPRIFQRTCQGANSLRRNPQRRRQIFLEALEDRQMLAVDLRPGFYGNWSDNIVISNVTGNNTDSMPILSSDTVRVDASVINYGSDTAVPFTMQLQLDSNAPTNLSIPALNSGWQWYYTDVNLGTLANGIHTLTLTVDSANVVAETNETNNVYTRQFLIGNADFGDAPTSLNSLFAGNYPTLLADSGAYHSVVSGFSLGTAVGGDLNGLPNTAANKDDVLGSDDEDGVVFNGNLIPGQPASATVTLNNTAALADPFLDAWLDFNRDGDWDDSGEQVFSAAIASGDNTLNFTVPANASVGASYSRFRLHSGLTALTPTGLAANGEVEDHLVNLRTPSGVWQFQGPASTQDGQVENVFPNSQISGATNVVLPHPSDPNILYIGSVNGGIWKTTNATATNPIWVPQLDAMASLSIGSLVFDTADPTFNTLIAGTGSFSSYGGINGGLGRIYRTTNGGALWTQLTATGLSSSAAITGIAANGSNIVVSTLFQGIYRSTNTGTNFSTINSADFTSGSSGHDFTDLIADPSDATAQRIYAVSQGPSGGTGGVYRSDDGGLNWTRITSAAINSDMHTLLSTANMIELTVHPTTGRLFAGVLVSGQPRGVFYTDSGISATPTWTQMDVPVLPMGAVITNATNASPIVITANSHGLTTGNSVTISGVAGNTAANGTFTVTVLSSSTFQLNSTTGNGTYTGGGSIVRALTAASNASPIVVTSVGHGLQSGNYVVVGGVTGNTAANGFFRVTRVDSDNFRLDTSVGNGTYTGGGTFARVTGPNPSSKTFDEIAGGQGRIHFSILVDPTDHNILYIGGDRQEIPNSIGDNSYGGAIFRGNVTIPRDPTVVPSPQWDHLTNDQVAFDPTGGTASGSGSHADSREMAFDAAGNLIEVDDGGIFKRTSPRDNTGDWYSISGTLGVAEFHDIAYDNRTNIVIGGSQDNGTQMQRADGSTVWRMAQGGDGGDVVVDSLTLAASQQSIRYASYQNFGGFTRSIYDQYNNFVSSSAPALTLVGGGNAVSSDVQFKTPLELNVIDPQRMIIAGFNNLWESTDQGSTVRNISSSFGANDTSPIVYGGRRLGVDNVEVLYTARSGTVYVRQSGTGAPTATAYTGSYVYDITLDPNDWMRAFVVDANNSVSYTTNAGASWTNITGNLSSLTSGMRTVQYIPGSGGAIVVGGEEGAFTSQLSSPGVWIEIGSNLPNALVYDMVYDATDDILVVGTLGRGAWSLTQASTLAAARLETEIDYSAGNLVVTDINGGGTLDALTVSHMGAKIRVRDANVALTPTAAALTAGAIQVDSKTIDFPVAAITGATGVIVNTLGGNDSLTIDFTGGSLGVNVSYNGGNPTTSTGDTLAIIGGDQGIVTYNYTNGHDGSIVMSNFGTINFTGVEPITNSGVASDVTFNLPLGPNTVTFGDDNTIGNTVSRLSASTLVLVDFVNPTNSLTINRGNAMDVITINALSDFNASLTLGTPVNPFGALTISGTVTLAANRNLIAYALGTISLSSATSDIATSGGGAISLTTARNISLVSGSSITTVDGDLTLLANQQATPSSGNYIGIQSVGNILVSGSGSLNIRGRGGNSGNSNYGLRLESAIQGGSGPVTLIGVGGPTTGITNSGVFATGNVTSGGGDITITGTAGLDGTGVYIAAMVTAGNLGKVTIQGTGGAGTSNSGLGVKISNPISSSGGDVIVSGQGAGGTGISHYGVLIDSSGTVTAGGMGNVVVTGTGGNSSGGFANGVYVLSTGEITSSGGNISVTGTGGGTGAASNNYGVQLYFMAQIVASGAGTVTVNGTGGVGSTGSNYGVQVFSGSSRISSAGGNVNVIGRGGTGGTNNYGVTVGDASITAGGMGSVTVNGIGGSGGSGSSLNIGVYVGPDGTITSSGGDVFVVGQGGNGSSGSNHGVSVSWEITSGGIGKVSVDGRGATSGGVSNSGVFLIGTVARITSGGGSISITSSGSSGTTGHGLNLTNGGSIISVNNADITVTTDSLIVAGTPLGSINSGSGATTIRPKSAGTPILLGAPDELDPSPRKLGLTDAELDRITAGVLQIGDANSGTITVSADITRPAATNVELMSGADILLSGGQLHTSGGTLLLDSGNSPAAVRPTKAGIDVMASTLAFGSDLAVVINGTTVDTQYTQLNVVGQVNLTGVTLALSGTLAPAFADSFVIVKNDAADPIVGTFNGLPEGAALTNFLGSGLTAYITYVGNADGGGVGNDVVIFVDSPTQIVTSLTPTASGVQVRLSKPLNTGVLNLSDANNVLGPTDVTLVGATSGSNRGSLVLDSDGRGFTFIKSGGPLAADTYTLTLRSAANGFSTPTSELLDGNNDGTTGDNYVQTFVVGAAPVNAVTVAVGDFIRGYGQAVNLPATGTAGIPITLSTGVNVAGANVILTYDPALLTISGGSSPLAGVTSSIDTSIPGQVTINVTSATQFSATAGVITLANLTATVPTTANYAAKHILNLAVQSLTDTSAAAIPSIADDGLHVASFRGDLNGSQSINTGDATLALRLQSGVLSTTGFTALQLVDPYFAADMNDDGTATTGDITGILRFLSGASGGFPRIPALPTGLTPPPVYAADPQIFIPTAGLSGRAGDVITVPVKINVTDPNGIDLAGLSVALNYDAKNFTLTNVRLADSLAGMGASFSTATPGLARFVAVRDVGPHLDHGFVGDLFLFDLTINANAIPGRFAIDLLAESAATDNNAQNLLIAPSILNGPDVNDGLISIIDSNAPRHNTSFAADVDADGVMTIKDILLTIFYFNQARHGVATTPATSRSPAYVDIRPDNVIDILDVLECVASFGRTAADRAQAKATSSSIFEPTADGQSIDAALLELLASDEGLKRKN